MLIVDCFELLGVITVTRTAVIPLLRQPVRCDITSCHCVGRERGSRRPHRAFRLPVVHQDKQSSQSEENLKNNRPVSHQRLTSVRGRSPVEKAEPSQECMIQNGWISIILFIPSLSLSIYSRNIFHDGF